MQQEETFKEALGSAVAYHIVDDRLEIENASGETILVFAKKAEFPMNPGDLVGTEWQLVSLNGRPPRRRLHRARRGVDLCASTTGG